MGIDTSWWDGELQIINVSRGGLTTPKSSSQKSKATRSFGPSKQIIHQMRSIESRIYFTFQIFHCNEGRGRHHGQQHPSQSSPPLCQSLG